MDKYVGSDNQLVLSDMRKMSNLMAQLGTFPGAENGHSDTFTARHKTPQLEKVSFNM